MGEIKTADVSELKISESTRYRDIKPENGTTFSDAQDYWHSLFSDLGTETAPIKTYEDDNGKVYRFNDELIPNNSYEINGYKYKTDDQGRIVSAEGKLRLREKQPGEKRDTSSMDSMQLVGKGDQRENDDRGHLIAWRFDGSDSFANMVPMERNLNQKDYNKMENMLADGVKDGADVRFKVEPKYDNDTHRPSEFVVTYSIDGDTDKVVFRNGKDD